MFVKIKNLNSGNVLTFLVDTGADISLIKVINSEHSSVNAQNKTTITGIGEGSISSIGSAPLELHIENIVITHNFHVVSNDFPIPCDGIIGMDFLTEYNCQLDFNKNEDSLLIRPQNFNMVSIPISNSCINHSMLLPARSEVIRKISTNIQEDLLVPNQEIASGVFIANSIVSGKNSFIRIMNTTKSNIVVDTSSIKTEKLDDYEVLAVNKKSSLRDQEILKKLQKDFPKQFTTVLTDLCSKYCDIFALENEQVTTNNFYKQKLRLNDKTPTYIKNYRIPHSQKGEIENQVNKLINDDIVEPSTSNYNSPLLLVPKKSLPNSKDKRWRLVVDYRQVNKKLIADKFPLPRIDDILDQLGRAKFFSCLDLMSGFHQIELEEKSRDITSFSTATGSYRFKRLPFGLKIAPNSFQRMMTLAFSGLKPSQAFLYMDDLVVLGCSEKHMLSNLTDVFELCRKYNLKLNPDKCSFFMHEVTFLGHKCTNQGILPDDSKFAAIRDYPIPKDAEEARRFVAFCNYYRRFIKNFAEFARHLTYLTKKNVEFNWTTECQTSFEYLKNMLMSPQILQYPDFNKEFCITTDASKKACGAVLCQEHDGIYLPVSYASKSFTKGESNKSTIEQELTAIHWAVNYFKPYIYGVHFRIKTDHRPLTYLFSMKNPSSKLTRMRLDLEEFDFTIEYLRGKDNHTADALSRITIDDLKILTTTIYRILKMTTRSSVKAEAKPTIECQQTITKKPNIYEVMNPSVIRKPMKLNLSSDHCFIKHGKEIIDKMMINEMFVKGKFDFGQFFPKLEIMANKHKVKHLVMAPNEKIFEFISINEFKNMGNNILINLRVGLLPKVTKLTKRTDINNVLQKYHDDPIQGGHYGITKTLAKIKRYYYWQNMTKDITKYVKVCEKCQKAKITRHTKTPLQITDTPTNAFDTVLIDTVGPFPRSENENEYAVTIICDLTKYLVTIPVRDKSANTIAKAIFETFVLTYGPMRTLITDMGTEYKNQLLTDLCKYMKTDKLTSTAYHHQTLGTIEKSHRTFNEYVRSYIACEKTDWDSWMKYFTYCFNTTPSVTHGYCPYELVFGKLPLEFKTPSSRIGVDPLYNVDDYSKETKYRLEIARSRAKELLHKNKLKQKLLYDEKINKINLRVGDKVIVRNDSGHKLDYNYLGPFRVDRIDNNGNVSIVGKNNKKQLIHSNRLKLFSE